MMSVSRNYFSIDEDRKLLKLVHLFGTEQWNCVASGIPNRTARQCRDRYKHYLDPNVNHNPWSLEENELLLKKVDELGKRWKVISQFFKNRTDVHIKNHYKTLISKDKFHYRNNNLYELYVSSPEPIKETVAPKQSHVEEIESLPTDYFLDIFQNFDINTDFDDYIWDLE